MSSTTDKAAGLANEAMGKVKQGVGNAIGSASMAVEGAAQEAKGAAQKAVGDQLFGELVQIGSAIVHSQDTRPAQECVARFLIVLNCFFALSLLDQIVCDCEIRSAQPLLTESICWICICKALSDIERLAVKLDRARDVSRSRADTVTVKHVCQLPVGVGQVYERIVAFRSVASGLLGDGAPAVTVAPVVGPNPAA